MIWRSGFFDQLSEEITAKILNTFNMKSERITILDAGCGEGSPLSSIRTKVIKHTSNDFLGVGLDISKDAIDIASKDYSNMIWCVSDIANCPFDRKQFNFILNILSPSNYTEFQRLLAEDGMVIKVIPERDYLQEWRAFFYEQTSRQIYSNENTLDRFRDHFKILNADRLRYHFTLDHTLLEHLIKMTPLSWGTTEIRLQQFLGMNAKKITVDLTILLGKPH
jgi:23S rRNA (guanine745-N1)-methyltransferase